MYNDVVFTKKFNFNTLYNLQKYIMVLIYIIFDFNTLDNLSLYTIISLGVMYQETAIKDKRPANMAATYEKMVA